MIFLYNETMNKWTMSDHTQNDRIVSVQKVRAQPPKGQSTRPDKQIISIISYQEPFGSDIAAVKEKISSATKTEKVIKISNETTGIVYNQKAFRPFITRGKKAFRSILFASIALRGQEIVDCSVNGAYLLEHMVFGDEISFIGSFPEGEDSRITFTTYNKKTNRLTDHNFTCNAAGSISHGKFVHIYRKPEKLTRTEIYNYRPSFPTYIILTHPDDRDKLNLRYPELYQVIDIENINTVECIQKLRDLKFRAVTLFVNLPSTNTPPKIMNRYQRIIDALTPAFPTVFRLHSDNRIVKVQYEKTTKHANRS